MSILVYVETRRGMIKKAGLEALSEGKRVATHLNLPTIALLVGANLDSAIAEVKKCGADRIFLVENKELVNYQSEGYLAAVVEAVKACEAKIILLASTTLGRDLAPRIAAKLQVMLLPDVTALKHDDGNLIAHRPAYGGKVYLDLKAKMLPVVISTRPNVFDVAEAGGAGEVASLAPQFTLKAKVIEVVASGGGKLDVAEADRIVSGGRGMKSAENFKMLEELAEVLGAAVGASRAVVDAGWRPHSEQVGQTGKTVGPNLYIAVGISGAVQHLAGMQTSKVIVAINSDPDAPIFKVADYGIVGDALEVIPKLTEVLKK